MAGSRGWVMGAPYSRWGTGKWREAWESCGATENPCLTCRDCTHPAPSPALPKVHPLLPSSCRGLCSPRHSWTPGLPWWFLSLENDARSWGVTQAL